MNNVERAKKLAALGVYVFPVLVTDNPENRYKKNKKPAIPEAHPDGDPLRGKCTGDCGRRGHGFYDSSIDPYYIEDLWEKRPNAEVGVYMGKSGLVAADFDVKRAPDGTVEIDGFESFERQWLDLPSTHSYDSISAAGGKQYIYAAPEGLPLGPAAPYRGMQGVDRRGGGSYSVWVGDVPDSRAAFAPAPQWLLDPATVRTTERFEGSVREWLEGLEPGSPDVIVRAAMDRTRQVFEQFGNDFDHGAMVERQFEAVRLGSEGHSGVTELLDLTEELFLSRTGSHSRTEAEWDWEWSEALSSAISKYGAASELRKWLPVYSLSLVPTSVPDRLISGEPGDRETFRELLAALLSAGVDDLTATSVLWNSPRTKALARDWGLEFCHKRVQEARIKPEPVRENPTLVTEKPDQSDKSENPDNPHSEFLSAKELTRVTDTPTFIDDYVAASATKGFVNAEYDIPAAWTCLSMAFGAKAYVPYVGAALELNLWYMVVGYSGTGKSATATFQKNVLNVIHNEVDSRYSMSANSSPEMMEERLILRDGRATVIYEDEASSFFMNLRSKSWMDTLPDKWADWYGGTFYAPEKVRLKELSGRVAHGSLNLFFWATPDRFLPLIDASMFASGFLARNNWVWAKPAENEDARFEIDFTEPSAKKVMPAVFEVATDLLVSTSGLSAENPRSIIGTEAARKRLSKVNKAFYTRAKKHPRFQAIEPSITRLRETLLKCSALLALYRGSDMFTTLDVTTAIYYAETWFNTLLRVANEISESPYSRALDEMESFVKENGPVLKSTLLHHVRGTIVRSKNEAEDRINYLVESGRINKIEMSGREIGFETNG